MEETMRATQILRSIFRKSRISIHQARLKSVYFAIEALLNCGKLNLSSLGRGARSRVMPKHNIKRIDRLLGNTKLHREQHKIFKAITQVLVGKESRPLILIDWTKIEFDKFCAITAAVPLEGRAMPIYWRVYPYSKLANREVHRDFLIQLSELLPQDCKPILVTDAGFQNTWFEMVSQLEWDWVGRVGHARILTTTQSSWMKLSDCFRIASNHVQDLGVCEVAKKNQMQHRIILGKRFRRNPNRSKAPRRRSDRGHAPEQAKRRSMEPWVLVTSLLDKPAIEIHRMYAHRMSIEECYRDTKNHRFGWSFEDAKSSYAKRYEVLLLVATLAMLILFLIGLVMEKNQKQFMFQANTVRNQRVLSLFFLGKQMIHRPDWNDIKLKQLRKALKQIHIAISYQHA
jgi:hypothetical protein